MGDRPHYEVPADRAREYTAVAKLAKEYNLFIAYRVSETGQTLLQDAQGKAVAYVETKCRNNTAFKYPTLKISVKKLEHAKRAYVNERLPTFLLVQFIDRTMVVMFHPTKVPWRIGKIERIDRNDPHDIEPAAEIPMGQFREVNVETK